MQFKQITNFLGFRIGYMKAWMGALTKSISTSRIHLISCFSLAISTVDAIYLEEIIKFCMEATANHTQTVAGWAGKDSSGKVTPYVFKRR